MTNKTTDKNIIPGHLLARLNEFISENMGLYFPEKRRDDLKNKFLQASKAYGFSDPVSCIHWLLSAPLTQEQIETLSSYLTIGETHFYRDKRTFNELEKNILPELIDIRKKTGKNLKIWSVGCSSGEEPYSIAILLDKIIPDISDWNITILATDINSMVLKKAEEGIYKKWSFRGTPEWVKNRYFIKTQDGSYAIKSFVKKMVTFSYHNVAKDPFPSLLNNTTATDIIFCRNVIMYFRPQLARKIINRFYRSLINGGWLLVSGSEGYLAHKSRFVTVTLPEAIFFRKDLSKYSEMEKYLKKTSEPSYQNTLGYDPGIFPEVTFSIPDQPVSISRDTVTASEQKQPDRSESQRDPLKKAVKSYDQGNYREAEDLLTEYLMHDPENHEAISLLAKACSNMGKFSKAMDLCRQGITLDKFNPGGHYLLALICLEQGKIEEAISSLHRAIYLDPNHVLSHYTLGNILSRKGNSNKAEKYFTNALSILNMCDTENILPESDGVSAGRLMEIIKIKTQKEILKKE